MITIHMTTYSRLRSGLLPAAIHSVLDQDFTDFEFVICDDASVDGSAEFLAGVARRDARVRLIRNERNVNSVAISLGRCLMRSDPARPYVSWMFDDCVLRPGALRRLVERIRARPVDMLFGVTAVHLKDGGVLEVGERPADDIRGGVENSSVLVPNAGILVRREVFDRVGWYDTSIVLRRSCDWDLFRRIIGAGIAFETMPQTLVDEHGDLQHDSLRNAFSTTFEVMRKYARARDASGITLDLATCLSKPPDWIPTADWTAAELRLMQFMFLEYYLSVGDLANALRWAERLEPSLPGSSLMVSNLRRARDDESRSRGLMAAGAYAGLIFGLHKQQLVLEGRLA